MDDDWEVDRVRLYYMMKEHPKWSIAQLARELNRSITWVKKWRKRFRDHPKPVTSMFKSQSRAPHHRPKCLSWRVRMAILSFRDELKNIYNRVVGAQVILYYLHKDSLFADEYLPRSSRTIHNVLKEGGRIPTRIQEHHPVMRPDPMTHWELDFGQLADKIEFLSVVDRGTSILVDTQADKHYTAETALLAIYKLFVLNGLPDKLRFDRDTRFVGSWGMDDYPSTLMRFLLCLGVQPDPTPPRRPDLKPFVERSIRTIKYECLWRKRPETPQIASEVLETYRFFYNTERVHRSTICNNKPPYEAFPALPKRPQLPETVNPDVWLRDYDRSLFKRKLNENGATTIDSYWYSLGVKYANKKVAFRLEADLDCFQVIYEGSIIGELEIKGLYRCEMPFMTYLQKMVEEARHLQTQSPVSG